MVTKVISAIGVGQDFPTLAAWARALPPDLPARNETHIAELSAGPEDPGGAVVRTRCDASHEVVIRAAAGHGFASLNDPVADPLAPGHGLGATIRCPAGDAIRVEGAGTRLRVESLQILAEDGSALADDEQGTVVAVISCLIDAMSMAPAVTLSGEDALLCGTCLIQRGGGDGAWLADGASAHAVTVLKPTRALADGTGIAGTGHGTVQSAAVFGFRRAFGPGVRPGAGTASDQVNLLGASGNFADRAWLAVRGAVDPLDTVPGPFAQPLQWLSNNQSGLARFDHAAPLIAPPGACLSLQAIVSAPTALSSGIMLASPAGEVALKVNWIDTPPSSALMGRPGGLAAVEGGLDILAPDLYRLRIVARNRTPDSLEVRPALQVTAGIENAGLNVGLYAGCLMAGPGHLGHGFVEHGDSSLVERQGLDPALALRNPCGVLPDLRPIEGGPLDRACPVRGPDILGHARLAPETLGAITLNPAPRFVATPL